MILLQSFLRKGSFNYKEITTNVLTNVGIRRHHSYDSLKLVLSIPS
jgi:hypothetical protein